MTTLAPKTLYLGRERAGSDVEGRGPSLPVAIFDDAQLAETWRVGRPTQVGASVDPMPLITQDIWSNFHDYGEMLEQRQEELAALQIEVESLKKLTRAVAGL